MCSLMGSQGCADLHTNTGGVERNDRMSKHRRKLLISLQLYAAVFLTLLAAASAENRDSANLKFGEQRVLPPSARAQIAALIGEDDSAYHALRQLHGFRMNNERHELSAEF